MCRLLAGHPNLRLAGVHANSSAGRRLGELQPHLPPFADRCSSPATPTSLAGHDVVVLALPHGAVRGDRRPAAATTPLVVDCGADHRLTDAGRLGSAFYGGAHAGTWPYGLPELRRGQRPRRAGRRHAGSPSPAATRPRSPSPSRPALAAGLRRARRRRRRRGQRHVRRGQGGSSRTCSAARSWARCSAVRRRRRAPAHPGDRSEPRWPPGEPVTLSLHPDARADGPRHPRHLHGPAAARHGRRQQLRAACESGLRRRAVRAPAARGPVAAHRGTLGANTAHSRSRVDADAGRVVVVAAIDNLTKGTAGGARPVRQPRPRPARDRRPPRRTESHRERHRPAGLPRRRRRRRAQGERRPRPRARRQRRPGPRRRRRLHHQPRQGRAGAVDRAGRRRRRVARGRPQLRRRQRVHRPRGLPGHPRAPPRRSPPRSACRRDRRRRLLHRAHRRCGCPMDKLIAGVTTAAAALSDDGGHDAAARDHDHRHRRRRPTRRSERDGWIVGGMAKGAGMLAPALATMLVVLTTDAVVDGRTRCDAALRAATGVDVRPRRLRRLPVDQRHRARCMASGASRASTPTADEFTDGAHRGLRPTSPGSCSPTPRARPRTSRSPCAAPRPRGRRSRSPAPSPATTCSSPRCSATTPTGAGCSPRSARPTRAVRPRPARRHDQRRPVCRRRRVGEDRARRRPAPAARSPSSSTCTPATSRRRSGPTT